jgi:cytochrome P450 family 2 subfamily B
MLHLSGVIFTNGKPWKVSHQFCLTFMKYMGIGKWSIKEKIKEEAQCLVEELQKFQLALGTGQRFNQMAL